MFNYEETLRAMKSQRVSMQQELDRLDRAISALQVVLGSPGPASSTAKPSAQRKRLAKVKQTADKKAKRTDRAKAKISAQGLRNIVEAQKKRWAKVRAAKAKEKSTAGKKSPQ